MRNTARCLVLALSAWAGSQVMSDAAGSEALYRQVQAAAVEILCRGQLAGGGWLADKEGHIITACHAVQGGPTNLEIMTAGGRRVPAELLQVDGGHDLAVLRAAGLEGVGPPLSVARQFPAVGEEIYLFGPPLFRHRMMIPGRVARPDAAFEYLPNVSRYVEVRHVAAMAPPGFSGGWGPGMFSRQNSSLCPTNTSIICGPTGNLSGAGTAPIPGGPGGRGP